MNRPAVWPDTRGDCITNSNINNNEMLIKHTPVVYTRAWHAVQKNKKIAFRLGQCK